MFHISQVVWYRTPKNIWWPSVIRDAVECLDATGVLTVMYQVELLTKNRMCVFVYTGSSQNNATYGTISPLPWLSSRRK